MGYTIELKSLVTLPPDFDETTLTLDSTFTIDKTGQCLYPLHKPIEFCTSTHYYLGKCIIDTLLLSKDKTTITCRVIKLFNTTEREIFSHAFVKTTQISSTESSNR